MKTFSNISAKQVRLVTLAAVPLALVLAQSLPVSARTSASGIDAEKSPVGTSFMSGGIGLEERQKMMEMAQPYDLKLAFADRRGEYLSDVKVTIDDEHGKPVLNTTTAGPWLYADLPQGKYDVKASFGDRTEEIKDLQITRGRLVNRVLHWENGAQQITQR